MKKFVVQCVLWVLCFSFFLSPAFSQMLITGVIDGPLSGGLPKAVEFYALEDIADLSIFGFGSANNGGGSDGQEFTFPAVEATKGQYLYVATEDTSFNSFFGFYPDYKSGAANINGDDAIELFRDGAVIDVFGDINVDGTGEPWEYMDGWAYRKDGTGPDGSTFVLDNWFFSGPNALDGENTNASAATPFPIGSYEPPVAVHLASFNAWSENGGVLIAWSTASEVNCAGFNISKSRDERGQYEKINESLIVAKGAAGIGFSYTFMDESPGDKEEYYKLEEIDLTGQSLFYGPVQVDLESGISTSAPLASFKLLQNFPNPFNSSTIISYSLNTSADVSVHILDLRGRVIRRLVDAPQPQGAQQARWNGLDDLGRDVCAGVYFYQLRAGDRCAIKKMTLLR